MPGEFHPENENVNHRKNHKKTRKDFNVKQEDADSQVV